MEPLRLIRALQLSDSFFPVGAFAYSDGLETAATAGRVRDASSLSDWMNHFVDGVFVPCEGLAVMKCVLALEAGDSGTLYQVDEELTALRPAAAIRAASVSIGKRLLSMYAAMMRTEPSVSLPHTTAPVAYAVVFFDCGLSAREATLVYGYNRLAGTVSAALRLISLGQLQGQTLLTTIVDRLPAAVDRIFEIKDEPLRSFNPLLDIDQMNHQYLYSRLFRS